MASSAKKLPSVDVVLVGFGWTGGDPRPGTDRRRPQRAGARARRLARHLDGFRGRPSHRTSCATCGGTHLFEEPARETLTFRNDPSQTALPMRQLGSFLPGTGVGGAGVHWNGQTWRFLPTDFQSRAATTSSATAQACRDDMTVQDWGITYDELEPYYDQFEYLCGIGGKAGNLKGQIQPGGNPFEGARSRDYPNPPLDMVYGADAVCKRRRRNSATTRSRARPPTCRGPIPTRSACSSGPAPIAASARNSAAATIPRPARRPRSCRC